jgi:hypothetical protein
VDGAAQRIQAEVLGWHGLTAAPHRFGGVELRVADVDDAIALPRMNYGRATAKRAARA